MKKILIVLSVLFLIGCSDTSKTPTYAVYNKNINGDSGLTIYTIDGVEIECLWKGRGMSCNWEKFNKVK